MNGKLPTILNSLKIKSLSKFGIILRKQNQLSTSWAGSLVTIYPGHYALRVGEKEKERSDISTAKLHTQSNIRQNNNVWNVSISPLHESYDHIPGVFEVSTSTLQHKEHTDFHS